MSNSRRIAVFYKSDGRCIHDDLDEESSRRPSDKRPEHNISGEALWPVIQVFMQFSREVQGGSVKRLVFRNPAEYAPPAQRFEPAPPAVESGRPPVVVHLAHDDLFVVAVTELLAGAAGRLDEGEDGSTSGVALSDFCTSLLDFLRGEQENFLRSPQQMYPLAGIVRAPDSPTQRDRGAAPTDDGASLDGFMPALSSPATTVDGMQNQEQASASARNPVVSIDVVRLTDHIAQNQNLLRM